MDITWIAYHSIERHDDQYVSNVASVRYRLLIPACALGKLGHRINLLQISPEDRIEDIVPRALADAVIVSKLISPDAEIFEPLALLTRKIVQTAKAAGCKAIADISDDHFSHPMAGGYFRALVNEVDCNIASTPKMAEIVRRHTQRPVFVIGDPYEGIRGLIEFKPPKAMANGLLARVFHNIVAGRKPQHLRLLWFGHGSNVGSIIDLLPDIGSLTTLCAVEIHLVTSPHPVIAQLCAEFNENYAPACTLRFSEWSTDATWQALRDCDMVVIPIQKTDPSKLVKSPNRVVEAIWAGRFVVANPIPAYQAFGDFTWLGNDIVDGIRWALEHPGEVKRRIAAGQEYVEKTCSPEVIARQWDTVLNTVLQMSNSVAATNRQYRLNLGCGDKILPGYINVDIAENRNGITPDVICDLHCLTFPDNSVEEILSVHVVEHFWRWQVVDTLREWVRVLRPGGKMILECPNLLSACQELLRDPNAASGAGVEGQRSMWVLYGDPAWRDPLMVHRWGYTPYSLAQVMAEAGLVNIRQEPAQFKLREPRDMRIVGEKPL